MSSTLESVARMAGGLPPEGGIRSALERAARAHQDPEFETRLNARRGELAALPQLELEARAARAGIEPPNMRAWLVEQLAGHEVAQELTAARQARDGTVFYRSGVPVRLDPAQVRQEAATVRAELRHVEGQLRGAVDWDERESLLDRRMALTAEVGRLAAVRDAIEDGLPELPEDLYPPSREG